jgi:hypothetical protein
VFIVNRVTAPKSSRIKISSLMGTSLANRLNSREP